MLEIDLRAIPSSLQDLARDTYDKGDILDVVKYAHPNELAFVFDNQRLLLARGIYEKALIEVWSSPKHNYHNWQVGMLRYMWELTNRGRLREIAPLPRPRLQYS